MPVHIIIGAQWGDEGKGHITDMMAAQANVVARFSGGDNAGHTVTIGSETFKLHLIPSGIIHDDVTCLIGNGTVINPAVLLREIDDLAARGIEVTPERLKISYNAHLITPAHIALDKASEQDRGEEAIGTTQRGIGPAYTDKVSRCGLHAGLFSDPEELADQLVQQTQRHNRELSQIYGAEILDETAVAAQYAHYAQRLAPYLVNSTVFLDEVLQAGGTVLAEGAQGTFLDVDHGTYPFVTSSSPTAGGALVGLGVGPKQVGRIIGISKAFTSRVGSGPFPTELDGEQALRLRGTGDKPWDEYGTTTGRPRRVGWLDTVLLRHAVRVNSFTELVLTKLDILSGLPEIPICVAYEHKGKRINEFPPDLKTLADCQPLYEILPGWEEDIMNIQQAANLPANARRYIDFITQATHIPISYVSVGPGRKQVITLA